MSNKEPAYAEKVLQLFKNAVFQISKEVDDFCEIVFLVDESYNVNIQ